MPWWGSPDPPSSLVESKHPLRIQSLARCGLRKEYTSHYGLRRPESLGAKRELLKALALSIVEC